MTNTVPWKSYWKCAEVFLSQSIRGAVASKPPPPPALQDLEQSLGRKCFACAYKRHKSLYVRLKICYGLLKSGSVGSLVVAEKPRDVPYNLEMTLRIDAQLSLYKCTRFLERNESEV